MNWKILLFFILLIFAVGLSKRSKNRKNNRKNVCESEVCGVKADNSCAGRCGAAYNASWPCACNDACVSHGDCCSDYQTQCGGSSDTSCSGRCNIAYDSTLPCQCNDQCLDFGDCCSDYTAQCVSGDTSCNGRCNIAYDSTLPCQCNDQCEEYNDCCSDYTDYCTSSSDITNQEIYDISSQIWDADAPNRLSVDLDWQGQISDGSTTDKAPGPLCVSIPPEVYTNPLYVAQMALYDDYVADENVPENMTDEDWAEVDAFLTQVMSTEPMQLTNTFLASKGLVSSDPTSFQATLRYIWYTIYERQGQLSSSGAEHVQLGEKESGNTINGLHNWVRFCTQEADGHINYLGYVQYELIGDGAYVIRNPFYWDGYYKPVGGFFIGTSPAFDMSVFTLCWYARPNAICNTMLNGIEMPIQTYVQNGSFVGSSYPNY